VETRQDRMEILQDTMRKVFNDPEFCAEFQKLVSDEVTPFMPEGSAKIVGEMLRDPVIDMLNQVHDPKL
jgi:hypothetical protein